jgi:predicted porin
MKRSLIALAVAGAFAAPAAMADTNNVSIYGTIDMTFGGVSATGKTSALEVASNVTKLGFKGSQDVGEGLSVVWQIEQQIDVDNTNQGGTGATNATNPGGAGHYTFAGRDSWGGLSGNWGLLLLGKHDTPYKMVTSKFDLFHDELADSRAIMGLGGAHDARLGNVIAYVSPTFSGFTVVGAYVAGAELPVSDTATSTSKATVYSLNGTYSNGPVDVGVAYQSITIGALGTGTFGQGTSDVSALNTLLVGDSTKAEEVGAGYNFDIGKVVATYEKISSSGSVGNALDMKNINVGAMFNIGNDDVKVAYTKGGNVGEKSDTAPKQMSLGYDHNLSKMTKLYFVYTKVTNGSAAQNFAISNTGSTAGGVAPVAGAAGLGGSSSGWGIGFKHSF